MKLGRSQLAVLIFFVVRATAVAQSQFNVLPWKAQTSHHTHLLSEFHSLYDQRRNEFNEAVSTKENLLRYQQTAKKRYLDILGSLPEKTPLNPIITGVIREERLTIEKIVYQSTPGNYVTANLYLPKKAGKHPGVLFFCGHEIEAKATESYQKTARLFAENGFAVLVIDPISQGERIQLVDTNGKSLTRGATTEHTLLNAGANLLGTSVAAYELWDNIRGLDYLVSRPEVDPQKIGCLGNSGGGNQTAYFMAYDERVKVAALCSFFTQRERYVELSGPQDGCQQIPFETRAFLEITDFSAMFAPKPLIVLAGAFDFVDYPGTQQEFASLQRVYKTLGHSENVDIFSYPDGHGISQPKREAAVSWFSRWLFNENKEVKEPEFQTLTSQELNCTEKGQVLVSFSDAVSCVEREMQRYKELSRSRSQFLDTATDGELRARIKELLAMPYQKQTALSTKVMETVSSDHHEVSKIILHEEGEMPVPLLVYYPQSVKKPKKLVLVLDDQGKSKSASNDSLIDTHISKGEALILADLRGFGETEDDTKANDSKYWNREYRNATISLFIGRPVLGQRVIDLQTIIGFSKANPRLTQAEIEVVCNGLYQPALLHATLLDDRIVKVRFQDELTPYKSFIENPLRKDMYTQVIPGVLRYYDLPDLIEKIGKTRIVFE